MYRRPEEKYSDIKKQKNISDEEKNRQEQKINKTAEDKKLFARYDEFKQLGMYSSFVKGTTVSLHEHFMEHEITENNLQAFCHHFFRYTNCRFLLEVLRKECGDITGIIDRNNSCVQNNLNFQYIVEFEEYFNNNHGGLQDKFRSTALELEKLVDYMNKNK